MAHIPNERLLASRVEAGEDRPDIEGLFGPRSMLWQVSAEAAGLLGAGRSILLQIAHPKIAAGVAEYSSFQKDPLGRLDRTLDMMLTIVFGDRAAAEAKIRAFHRVHAPVHGQLDESAGPFSVGEAYTAQDPALKLWVHATLMDTNLLVYQKFVKPLSLAQQTMYYADSLLLARRLGIPASILPPTLADFQDYMREMLDSDTLTVTDTARALSVDILDPPVWLLPRLGGRFVGFVTAGLLPQRLREAYGLSWGPRRQTVLDALGPTTRFLLPLLPDRLRLLPQARAAESRLQ